MILKAFDTGQDIERLQELAAAHPEIRKDVDQQIRFLRAGMKGESQAAHYIDHDFGHSENWVVIHGLRLEHKGRVAQIDHLMINRALYVVLLETKHSSSGLKVTEEGEFLRWFKGSKVPTGMPSPFAQNTRHELVLKEIMGDHDILPKRFGMKLSYHLISYVLFNPEARVQRPEKYDTSRLIPADQLRAAFDSYSEKIGVIGTLARVKSLVSSDVLREIGQKIADMHVPITIDYAAKFGVRVPKETLGESGGGPELEAAAEMIAGSSEIDDESDGLSHEDKISVEEIEALASLSGDTPPEDPEGKKGKREKTKLVCATCNEPIEFSVARFCWFNKRRFGGKIYCRSHQTDHPISLK